MPWRSTKAERTANCFGRGLLASDARHSATGGLDLYAAAPQGIRADLYPAEMSRAGEAVEELRLALTRADRGKPR
jgi:hypothetical protein